MTNIAAARYSFNPQKDNAFIVVDLFTGFMDGNYATIGMARAALDALKEMYPKASWHILEIKEGLGYKGYPYFADHLFVATNREKIKQIYANWFVEGDADA